MTSAAAPQPPQLATVLCVEYGSGDAADHQVPGAVVVELPRHGEHAIVQGILQAVRMHPGGRGPAGGRVAFLALFVGFDDRVLEMARHPELGTLPILVSSVPAGVPEAITEAVGRAQQELVATPGFSISVRTDDPVSMAIARVDEGADPAVVPWPRGRVASPGADDRSVGARLAAGVSAVASAFGVGRRDRGAVPQPAYPGEEAGLLAVVSVDGPGADRATRALQRRLVTDLRAELADQSRVRWLAGGFRAAEDVHRIGPTESVTDLKLRSIGSRPADEIGLSAVCRELLADVVIDREAMARRGWTPAWTAALFLAPGMPYVGVRGNPYFDRLAGSVDQILWIGTEVDTVAKPLRVEGVGFLKLHADSGRETADVLLGGSGLRATRQLEAPAQPSEAVSQDTEAAAG